MKILVLNAGSSSLRYQVFQSKSLKSLYQGMIQRIGVRFNKVHNHSEALTMVFDELIGTGILETKSEITAVGHRVVHGGEEYTETTHITPQVLKDLQKLSDLAPLHNPANLEGIRACQKIIPKAQHWAVFDTAFHATLPEEAYLYGLPYEWYRKNGIRRYGFHGTSHKYVSQETRATLGKSKSEKIITCHLGNGCSITAVHKGKSVNTSMGFTPLEGVMMGTRSGSIDPAIIFYLEKHTKLSYKKIEHILEHESGFQGLSGISSDVRDIWKHAQKSRGKKAEAAKRTLGVFAHSITHYIGAYAASMNGLDALVFTAGIGENAWYLRKMVCDQLTHLGLKLDTSRNKKAVKDKGRSPAKAQIEELFTKPVPIHATGSKVKILVIPTNEELQIAREIKL